MNLPLLPLEDELVFYAEMGREEKRKQIEKVLNQF
jgi:hypothetical protein